MMALFKDLLFVRRNSCYLCRQAYGSRLICPDCQENLEVLDRAQDLGLDYLDQVYVSSFYNRFLRKIIIDFKFRDRSYLYRPLGQLMVKTLEVHGWQDIDLVLAVPVSKKRRRQRGYNQAGLLASYISQALDLRLDLDLLVKSRHTRAQSSLDLRERRRNLRGSFDLRQPADLAGRRILLVDDVITSGATLNEIARLLKGQGALSVRGLVISSTEAIGGGHEI